MSKADNMLSILWLLQSRRRLTAAQLAETLEMNIRTVYRYIDALCASGVPIIADAGHGGGYSLLHDFSEAPLLFDAEEQKALMQAALFAEQAGYPHGEALQRAVAKLKTYSHPERLSLMDRHLAGFDVIHPPTDETQAPLLQELERAAGEQRPLLIEYQKGYDRTPLSRRIDPYGLLHWKNAWYTVAYCHLRGEIRSFRVDRIRSFAPASGSFERPEGFSARAFFLKRLLPEPGQEQAAELLPVRITGWEQAISELCGHWLFSHGLVERTATEAHFRLEASMISVYVPYFLMPYGKSIRVLEPPLLQERLVSVASALLDYYRERGG